MVGINKSRKNLIISLLTMVIVSILLFTLFITYKPPFHYSGSNYSIQADTDINRMYVNGNNILAKYRLFQCEENIDQLWKVETPVRWVTPINNTVLMTYSHLYLYDVLKTFSFFSWGFTVNISKVYVHNGFNSNNQILADINNMGWILNSPESFTFNLEKNNIVISILWSNTPITIEIPRTNYPSEVQFNFNNQSDRDIAYHTIGTIESVLFSLTIT